MTYMLYYTILYYTILYSLSTTFYFPYLLPSAVEMIGASPLEYTLGYLAKSIHFLLVLAVPLYLHGTSAIVPYLAFAASGSVVLAWLFAVSHNLDEAKVNSKDGTKEVEWKGRE